MRRKGTENVSEVEYKVETEAADIDKIAEEAQRQLNVWKKGSGYYYWSYKFLTDTVNTSGWVGWDSWDLGRCRDFGWVSEL